MKIFKSMERRLCTIFAAFSAACLPLAAQQQKPLTEEEQAKKLDEFILTQVERMESSLKLEDWQTFYVDSILSHDYRAMQAELKTLSDSKVSNADLYTQVQDKWAEQSYNAFRRIFDADQWARYLKQGALREKKARDKRKEKIEKATAKLKEND